MKNLINKNNAKKVAYVVGGIAAVALAFAVGRNWEWATQYVESMDLK